MKWSLATGIWIVLAFDMFCVCDLSFDSIANHIVYHSKEEKKNMDRFHPNKEQKEKKIEQMKFHDWSILLSDTFGFFF